MRFKITYWNHILTELFFCFFIFFSTHSSANNKILIPETPSKILPPSTPKEIQEQKRKQKRQFIEEKVLESTPPEPSPTEVKKEQLKQEQMQVRDMQFMLQLSLIVPSITVKSPRTKYTTEPTSHIHFYFNGGEQKANQTSLWWGLRIAPFSGTGIYKGVPGRYSFTYFGPMIGLARINATNSSGNSNSENKEEKKISDASSAWFWMTGISGQTRQTKTDDPENLVDQDLYNTKKTNFDTPGLWTEFTYANIYHGALSTNYIFGTQLGKGKVFVWVGIGFAGWY